MKIGPTLFFLWIAFAAAIASAAEEGPNRPEPKPVTLDSKSTAVLVLDLNARCDDPKQVCSKITAPLGDFLDKARAASVPIIYTVSTAAKGKPIGELSAPLRRKENEVIIYPDGFDKFYSGELQPLLKDKPPAIRSCRLSEIWSTITARAMRSIDECSDTSECCIQAAPIRLTTSEGCPFFWAM